MHLHVSILALAFMVSGATAADLVYTNYLNIDAGITESAGAGGGASATAPIGTLGGNKRRALWKTDCIDLPDGYTATSVTLHLYQDWNLGTTGYNRPVDLYRVLKTWDEADVSWTANTASSSWSASGLGSGSDYTAVAIDTATTPGTNGYTVFDITSDVQAFLAGTADNYGSLTRLSTEANLARFRTSEDTVPSRQPFFTVEADAVAVPGTVVTNLPTADTHIRNGDTSFNGGSNNTALMGRHGAGTILVTRTLMRFDLSSLPSEAVIRSAQIRVYNDWDDSAVGKTDVIRLHRILADWDESEATWADRLTGTAWTSGGLQAGSDYAAEASDSVYALYARPTYSYADVTDDVVDMHAGNVTNHGWIAICQEESTANRLVRFRTKEETNPLLTDRIPRLIVRYTIPRGTVIFFE